MQEYIIKIGRVWLGFSSAVWPQVCLLFSWPAIFKWCSWAKRGVAVAVVQLLSHVQLFANPRIVAGQAPLSSTISWSVLKFMSIESVMLSNRLILYHPLLPLSSVFPSFRVFSTESALHIWWPKYRSFIFSVSPSNQYSGLISFRTDRFDLLAVQGTLKSLLQHHNSKASTLQHSAFLMVRLSHPCMTAGKTIASVIRTFVRKVMSLFFNMPPRFVIAFLLRNKCLLILWLLSPAVILEPRIMKSVTASTVSLLFVMKSWDWRPWSLLFECWVSSCFFTLLFPPHKEIL